MFTNFWRKLNKPIFCLAPMEQVTDCAFREMFARYSASNLWDKKEADKSTTRNFYNNFVLFTEFVNVDGLLHPEGRKKLEIDLKYTEAQRPIVAQIWGRDPEKFFQAAQIINKLKFDGVDINMGCPQSKEIAVGACAALIREPKLAQEIILAAKKGAGGLPVSVKTRIGYSKPDEMGEWVKTILQTEPAALILHGRTKQEMSKVPAHWDKIAEAIKIRDKIKSPTVILGNGDIRSYQEGLARVKESGADGVMVGRGAFGNPWFFRIADINADLGRGSGADLIANSNGLNFAADTNAEPGSELDTDIRAEPAPKIPIEEKLRVLVEHAELFGRLFQGSKPFVIMRKHFKAYASGFAGAGELRAKLMSAENLAEAKHIVGAFMRQRQGKLSD
ncbi:MAG: tRNA-dihydrouridine synthase [Patescibacteria group bacterium]|nr:tRNA-dihydrouridine synthase [Patescibacteria group bacterium]